MRLWSDPAEQLRQVAIEVGLETGEARRRLRSRGAGRRRREPFTELREVESHETDGRRVVEHGEKDVRSPGRRKLAEEDLARLTGMVERREGVAVELAPDFGRRCMDRRRERAGGHDVDGPGEPVLREHPPTRLEQEHEPNAGVVDEPAERLLDPGLDGGGGRSHGRAFTPTPSPLASSRHAAARYWRAPRRS